MSKAVLLSALTVGGVDYQSGVYNVTVVAEQTSAEVFIAISDDSIVEENETFTAVLSVPVTESAPTALLMWRYRTMVSRALYTCMSLSVDLSSHIVFIQTWLTSHSVRCPTR